MTITLASFLAEFPEFDPDDGSRDDLVQAKIDAAYLRTNAAVWGDMRDEGPSTSPRICSPCPRSLEN